MTLTDSSEGAGAGRRILNPQRARWKAMLGSEAGGSPTVPGDDAAVGMVGLAERVELLGGGGGNAPRQGEALADAKVARGPYVQAAELEHQEDLRCPPPDAPNGGETSHDLFVALAG